MKPCLVALALAASLTLSPFAWADAKTVMGTPAAHSVILDAVSEPLYEAGLAIVPSSDFGRYGSSSIIELDGRWDVAFFRDVMLGEMDLGMDFRWDFFTAAARDLKLPNAVFLLAADVGQTWRYETDTALQVRLHPGIYAAPDAVGLDALYMPGSFAVIQSFLPELSGTLGFDLQPSFRRKILPIVGLAWQPVDVFRLDAGLPRSRVWAQIDRDWSTALGLTWSAPSFQLDEGGDADREQMGMEDFRLYWGVTRRVADEFQVTGELGTLFGRTVEFKDSVAGLDRRVDVDNALYVRFALGGPF